MSTVGGDGRAVPVADPGGILDTDATAAPVRPPPRTFSSFAHRDFAVFWTAAIISNTASFMQSLAVPFVIYAMTGSTAWLGVSALASFVPPAAIGPVAGAMADRFDRRHILLVTQTLLMVMSFGLWGLWISGHARPLSILSIVLVSGLIGGINIACWQAFVPLLVPRRDLLNAVRLNGLQFTVGKAVGPALAGVVLARFGPGAAFFANAITFLLVIGALVVVRPRATPARGKTGTVGQEFLEGVRYVRSRRSLSMGLVSVFIVTVAMTGTVQLAPALARDLFHTGKTGYGLMVATNGFGSIVGSIVLAGYTGRLRASTLAIGGALIGGAGVLGLAAAHQYGVGLVALFVMGFGYVHANTSLTAAVQVQVAEAFRGRVVSIYLMANIGGTAFGAFALGQLADRIHLRATLVVAVAVLLVYFIVVTLRFDRLRPLDNEQPDLI